MNDFIDLTMQDSWNCISPYICIDQNYSEMSRPIVSRTIKHAIKKFLGSKRSEKGRTENFVREAYNSKWLDRDSSSSISAGGKVCVKWNTNQFVVNGSGLRKLHTLRIMKLIDRIKPKKVLDIGCGNGERILQLACRFPDVQFTGLDLTPGGIESAQKVQTYDVLPKPLIDFAPQPLVDLTAHKRANFVCASAKETPFADGEFDLVYTSLALEQMEQIRTQVFREIFRITSQYASFYEAFQDYNRGVVQRAYIYGEAYFQGRLQELNEIGFKETSVMDALPQKIYMNAVHVLAKK